MTQDGLILIVALIVFIVGDVAFTAIFDYILEPRKEAAPPPKVERTDAQRRCDRNGHAYVLREHGCAYICAVCEDRVNRDTGDLLDLGRTYVPHAELGHRVSRGEQHG